MMRFLIAAGLLFTSCGSASEEPTDEPTAQSNSTTSAEATTTTEATTSTSVADTAQGEQRFPDVVEATASQDESGSWTFSVTLSSPYDTPERYADSWRVRDAGGTVYGERFLTHDHANEQPFTRAQSGIEIPDTVSEVIIEGRDQQYGWGGTTLTLTLDRS